VSESERPDSPLLFHHEEWGGERLLFTDVSLRDLFAAAAIGGRTAEDDEGRARIAGSAYDLADAMLRERERRG
jgi:hypothetical protein